jgi:hypothetical protein
MRRAAQTIGGRAPGGRPRGDRDQPGEDARPHRRRSSPRPRLQRCSFTSGRTSSSAENGDTGNFSIPADLETAEPRPVALPPPRRRVTGIRKRATRETEPEPKAAATKDEKGPKIRKILCACGCGEMFEWEVKTGRAPQYIPEHKQRRRGVEIAQQTPREVTTDVVRRRLRSSFHRCRHPDTSTRPEMRPLRERDRRRFARVPGARRFLHRCGVRHWRLCFGAPEGRDRSRGRRYAR